MSMRSGFVKLLIFLGAGVLLMFFQPLLGIVVMLTGAVVFMLLKTKSNVASRNIRLGVIGVLMGLWVSIGAVVLQCWGEGGADFCGVQIIVYAPFAMAVGGTIGIVVGLARGKKEQKPEDTRQRDLSMPKRQEKSLPLRGYAYAALGAAWFTWLYWLITSDVKEGNRVVSWEIAGILSLSAFLFLAWFLKQRK